MCDIILVKVKQTVVGRWLASHLQLFLDTLDIHYLERTGVEGDRLIWTPATTGDQTQDKLIAPVVQAELIDHASSVACDKTTVKSLFENFSILNSIYTPPVNSAEANYVHAYFSR